MRAQRAPDEVDIGGEHSGDEQEHADASADDEGLARGCERPAAANEHAGKPAAEEVASIGGEERNPDGQQTAAQVDSFGDQVDGKPVGNKYQTGSVNALAATMAQVWRSLSRPSHGIFPER